MDKPRHTCKECGLEILPGSSLGGRCPRCLLEMALSVEGKRPLQGKLRRDDLPTESRFFAGYEILHEVARGGMGVVYKARQLRLKRFVALKVIKMGALASPDARMRFEMEIEAISKLSHPNIISLYEAAEHSGVHYFSMNLLEGGSLSDRIPSLDEVPTKELIYNNVGLLIKTCRAIHYAHQRGVLHRDLKPSNILLDEMGEPIVSDFGLVKLLDGDGSMTYSQDIIGTPHYMAPEQAIGTASELTVAVDIYSLGAILYQIITGSVLFNGETPLEVMRKVTDDMPEFPQKRNSAVDRNLSVVCMRCLEKDPSDRYASAEELANELVRWREGKPVLARSPKALEYFCRWCQRKPGLALSLFACVLLVIITAVVSLSATIRIKNTNKKVIAASEAVTVSNIENVALLTTLKIKKADDAFENGQVPEGLATLAHVLRSQPNHKVAGQRLVSELTSRRFVATVGSPLRQGGEVLATSILADEKMVCSISRDSTLRRWDARTGQLIDSFRIDDLEKVMSADLDEQGRRGLIVQLGGSVKLIDVKNDFKAILLGRHLSKVKKAVISSSGRYGAVIGCNLELRVWDLDNQQELTLPSGLLSHDCAFTGSDALLLIANRYHVEVVDMATLSRVRSFPKYRDHLTTMALSENEEYVAVASPNGVVHLGEISTGNFTKMEGRHLHGCGMLRFGPSDELLASASWDGTSYVWNTKTGKQVCKPLKHKQSIASVRFNEDGTRIITGSFDHSASVWDVGTGEKVVESLNHSADVMEAYFLGNDKQFVTLLHSGVFQFWRFTEPSVKPLNFQHEAKVMKAEYSPDGLTALTGAFDGKAKLWDVQTGKLLYGWYLKGSVTAIAFDGESRVCAIGCYSGQTEIRRIKTGELLVPPLKHDSTVDQLGFSPDGKLLAVGGRYGDVGIYRVNAGRQIMPAMKLNGKITGLEFSPDGSLLVSTSAGGDIAVLEVAKGQLLFPIRRYTGGVARAVFSQNGKQLFMAVGNEVIPLDVFSGDQKTHLVHEDKVRDIVINDQETRLVSASGDHLVKVWDLVKGDVMVSSMAHEERIGNFDWSPDGSLLVTASVDGFARIWDIETGHLVAKKMQHEAPLSSVFFSPDGKSVLTASSDHTAKVWRVPQWRAEMSPWLCDLAELMASKRLDAKGDLVSMHTADRDQQLKKLRKRISQSPNAEAFSGFFKSEFPEN